MELFYEWSSLREFFFLHSGPSKVQFLGLPRAILYSNILELEDNSKMQSEEGLCVG